MKIYEFSVKVLQMGKALIFLNDEIIKNETIKTGDLLWKEFAVKVTFFLKK